MLSSFPDLSPLHWSNWREADVLVSQFAPYSEFNVVNMWCWHAKYRDLGVLNGNLVLAIANHDTSETWLSFLGQHEVAATARQLLAAAPNLGCAPSLRLVPEAVLDAGPDLTTQFAVRQDQDCDYVLSVPEWVELAGSGFRDARRQISTFRRHHDAMFRRLDLASHADERSIAALFDVWAEQKDVAGCLATEHERDAIERFHAVAGDAAVTGFGLFVEGAMIGFLLCEYRPLQSAVLHFWKADRTFRGAYRYMLHMACRELLADGCVELNTGQDLGIPGLARAKQSFQPCRVLRKYVIAEA